MRSMRTVSAQCSMIARAYLASLAFLAFAATSAYAQGAVVNVDVSNRTNANLEISQQDALLSDLHSVKADALLLYTDYASRAGNELKTFLKNITITANDFIQNADRNNSIGNSNSCWLNFKHQMKKVEHDARRAAAYSGDSHHKFLLGHMIVFRMHINKSEDYLKKCDKLIQDCGLPCESTPRMKRWRRLAMEEIHRVRDDIQHTKKAYRDLVSHARRKLFHLRKQALTRGKERMEEYKNCIGE